MSKFNFRNIYLVLFPLSVLSVRLLAAIGVEPARLAQWSPFGCPTKVLLGWDCPSCGMTRSLLYAWNGDFDVSMRFHFGGVVFLVLGIFYYFLLVFNKHLVVTDFIRQIHSKKFAKLFFTLMIFLYSFWGFFFRTNV